MSKSVIALFHSGRAETLSARDLVLTRILQAAIVGIVFLASAFAGTITSSIFFHGVEL